MTTQVSTKLRLVRCPKCRQLLPELPGVLLYKCGGCDTTLEAKIPKTETSQTEMAPQATDSAARLQQDCVSEEKEARSPTNGLSSPCNGEPSSAKDKVGYQDEDGDSGAQLYRKRSVSNVLCASRVNKLDDEGSNLEIEQEECKNSLGENSRSFNDNVNDSSGELLEVRDFLDLFPSSGELNYNEGEESSPEDREHVEEEEEKMYLNRYGSSDENEGGDLQKMPKGHSSGDIVPNLPEHENKENDLQTVQRNDEESENCLSGENGGLCGNIRQGGVESPPVNITSPENRNASQQVIPFVEEGDDREGTSTFRRPGIRSVNMMSPDDEHLNHSVKKVTRNFGSASSMDTFGSSSLADPSCEPRIKLRDMTGSPATRSYYAYDGSDSSYDGTDDQMLEKVSRLAKRNSEDRFKGKSHMVNNGPETSSSPISLGKPFLAMNGRSHSHDESIEAKRNGHTNRNRMRMDGVSRLPFPSRDPLAERRAVISHHNLLPPRPCSRAADKPSYMGPNKIDLLRTVCELKEQLDRIHFSDAASNAKFPAEAMGDKFAPYYHGPVDMNHPGYYPQFNHGQGWTELSRINRRLAFSGDAAHYRHQINCSCLHCCPQDRHYSSEFPSQYAHYNNVQCVGPSFHGRCNVSCPQHYTRTEHSLHGCGTNFDDKHREDEIKRLQLKEKYFMGKRHLRPVAGGAPVVACYHCSELLQLPADFLVFKKRYHQLRCNACKKILKFSLLRRTHIIPYIAGASPIEPDDSVVGTDQRNLGRISHSNSSQQVESVLYLDDYGRSFDRSRSTEGEGMIMLPSYDLVRRNTYDRKISSASSYEHIEDKKLKSILPKPKQKSPTESFESAGPSSSMPKSKNTTSEIEEHPMSNSPLHRLMGYSSPSKVLRSDVI